MGHTPKCEKKSLYSDVFVRCGRTCVCSHGVWDSPARGALGSMSRGARHAFSNFTITAVTLSFHGVCPLFQPTPVSFVAFVRYYVSYTQYILCYM